MIHASTTDETPDHAAKLHQQFSALYSLLFKDGNPAGIKCLLHILFPRYKEVLRLPLSPPPTKPATASNAKNSKRLSKIYISLLLKALSVSFYLFFGHVATATLPHHKQKSIRQSFAKSVSHKFRGCFITRVKI